MYRMISVMVALLSIVSKVVRARCDDLTPSFPLPNLEAHADDLGVVRERLNSLVSELVSDEQYSATSFSIGITSTTKNLLSLHHTAQVQSKIFPGTTKVDGDSLYRIASMTKPFTVLAILQQYVEGTLHLDDSVVKYIPALNGPQNGSIAWRDITIKALASQISGIPRDIGEGDLAAHQEAAIRLGLPPVSPDTIPQCGGIVNYTRPCTGKDVTDWARALNPMFAPNQKSSYSNMNFDLLSLVIENVTGKPYEEYVQASILDWLDMRHSTFNIPQESSMVIPAGVEYYWNIDEGVQKGTGGLYSSSSDVTKFLRYVLTHHNVITSTLDWFEPMSWSATIQSFYGMPWEIFRTKAFLPYSKKPVTIVTKSGGLPGYQSIMIMVPEYGFGMTILVAGNGGALRRIKRAAMSAMIEFADTVAQRTLQSRYTGTFTAPELLHLNSSITVTYNPEHGLQLTRLISNGTDFLSALVGANTGGHSSIDNYTFLMVPTLLYQIKERKQGEKWRVLIVKKETETHESAWDNFCATDIDLLSYAGRPLTEVIFWGGDESMAEPAHAVELSAFRIVLDRSDATTLLDQEMDDEL